MIRTTLLAAALFAVTAVAADDKKPAKPDEKAMMEMMEKFAAPGPEHKKLDPLAGEWTYEGKFWVAPDAPPMEMKGQAKRTWILGGRFLQDEVRSEAQAGMPAFQGMGLTGYDNHTKKYVGMWVDTMATSIGYMTGDGDPSGKGYSLNSEQFDPMYNQVVKMRYVTKITGADGAVSEFYTTVPGQKEMKTGEITYKRKKK